MMKYMMTMTLMVTSMTLTVWGVSHDVISRAHEGDDDVAPPGDTGNRTYSASSFTRVRVFSSHVVPRRTLARLRRSLLCLRHREPRILRLALSRNRRRRCFLRRRPHRR